MRSQLGGPWWDPGKAGEPLAFFNLRTEARGCAQCADGSAAERWAGLKKAADVVVDERVSCCRIVDEVRASYQPEQTSAHTTQ